MTEPLKKSDVVRHVFSRKQRLYGRAVYLTLRNDGKRKYSKHLSIRYIQTEIPLRIGIAIGKRLGNAVQRNRMKRLLREYLRLHWVELPPTGELLYIIQKPYSVWNEVLSSEISTLLPVITHKSHT